MARFSYDGFKAAENVLGRMTRQGVRRLLEKGGEVAVGWWTRNIEDKRHSRTGEMLRSVGTTAFRENLDGGSIEVYPLETDSKGARNATKAYVTNYGHGGERGPKSGDRFITGNTKAAERVVYAAMEEEHLRIIAEARNGGK